MFAVIGEWTIDPDVGADEQGQALDRIVSGVSQLPGLVKGYWTTSGEGTRSHTFVVFENRHAAEAFAADVRGNIDNQRRAGVENVSLVIDEVRAQTT